MTGYDNLSTGQPPFLDEAAAPAPASGWSRATCSTATRSRAPSPGTTWSSTWPPTRTCASAPSTRAATSSRTPSAPATCWRPCARTACGASRSPRPARSTASPTSSRRPRRCPFPVQTSLYGASKRRRRACSRPTATASASRRCVFRLVSALGERYQHGHVFDFYAQAAARTRREIEVLGDGRQRKSYLYVKDCVEAMLLGVERARRARSSSSTSGTSSTARWTTRSAGSTERLGLTPRRRYTGGDARLDRRQPVHLPRRQPHAGARLEPDADHPRGGAADGGRPRGEPVGLDAAG